MSLQFFQLSKAFEFVLIQTKFSNMRLGYIENYKDDSVVNIFDNSQHKYANTQVTTELKRYTYVFFPGPFVLMRIDPVTQRAKQFDLGHLKANLPQNKHISYRICGVHQRFLYLVEANSEVSSQIVFHKLDTYLLSDDPAAKKPYLKTYKIDVDHEFEQSTICFHHLRGRDGRRLIYLHHYCFDREEDEHEVRIYEFEPEDCTIKETEFSYTNLEMFDVFEQNKIAKVNQELARIILRTFGNEKEIKEAERLMAASGAATYWFAECNGRVYLFDFGMQKFSFQLIFSKMHSSVTAD